MASIKEIAKRLANGSDSRQVERYLKAEAELIKAYYPQLRQMEIESIVHQRYETGTYNDIAATEIVPILMYAQTPSAPIIIKEAAAEYIAVSQESAQDGFSSRAWEFEGRSWEVWNETALGELHNKYGGDYQKLELALKRTAGLRMRDEDLNDIFKALVKKHGGFTEAAENEFSAEIEKRKKNYIKETYSIGLGYIVDVYGNKIEDTEEGGRSIYNE